MNKKREIPITIAMPKGRLLSPSVSIFERAGFAAQQVLSFEKTRKLIFPGNPGFLVIRPSDVARYVYHGSADVGIVGNDVLREQPVDVYEFLDLKFGACRLVLAGSKEWKKKVGNSVHGQTIDLNHVRISTKYPNICQRWAEEQDLNVQILPLNGSVEIAPLTGFSDLIVDLVESGKTLKENGLVEILTLMNVSARLIVNRSSLKTCEEIRDMIRSLKAIPK